jgi:hypothetical protein
MSSRAVGRTDFHRGRTDSRRLRILLLLPDHTGVDMGGPEIRGWQIADGLGSQHEITAAVRAPMSAPQGPVRLVPFTRRTLLREARRHDVVIGSCIPPYLRLGPI